MPTLKAIKFEEFPLVYDGQLRALDARMSEARWRLLLLPPWHPVARDVGHGLFEDGRLVGFAAYVRSEQSTPLGQRKFINISSWVVDEAYRHAALGLVMPAIREKDAIATILTPLPAVNAIFTKLGFTTLETHVRVHPIVPRLRGGAVRVRFGSEIPISALPMNQETVHVDHRDIAGTAVIEGRHGTCYVVYTVIRRRGVRGVRLHHVAPRDGLTWGLRALQTAVLLRHGALLVEYDRRLAVGASGPYFDIPIVPQRLYRATDCAPEMVSNAYSELFILNI